MAKAGDVLVDTLQIGAVDASAAPLYFWRAPVDCVIRGINLITSTGIAAHATDIMTAIALNVGSAGSGTTEIGRQTVDSDVTGYSAVTAKVPWPLILSTTVANRIVKAGEVVQVAITEGGTATSGDMANAQLQIQYEQGAGRGYS